MSLCGGCHCGAVRYEVSGDPAHVAICHCADCRKCSGAPMVSWAAFKEEAFRVIQGAARERNSSGTAWRAFCGDCGTPLWFRNQEALPGLVDIQSATLDDPDALRPQVQIQVAEQIGWMETAHELPKFQRFPGMV